MAPLPLVSNFAEFLELHSSSASEEQTCIWYLNKEKRRCKRDFNDVDRSKAFQLRTAILSSPPHQVPLEQLKEYVRLKCCKHHHRRAIVENGLTELLASKWQRELAHEGSLRLVGNPSTPSTIAETTTVQELHISSPATHRTIQTRLRSRQRTEIEAIPTSTGATESRQSAFRPYESSRPQSVSSKLITPLTPSSKLGSIYLYVRASSPGYVKIGYSHDVRSRLQEWQRSCGYKPILIAAFHDVPHMQKVESLIHHQLAEAWRKEQRCKKCFREHQEWFEIDADDAVKVAGQWCEWMKQAQPYGARGYLKGIWVDELDKLETRGSPVTAEALLSAHARLLELESAATEEVVEEDNTIANTTQSTLFAEEFTVEPDTDLCQIRELANCAVAMLGFMQNFDRSLLRTAQLLLAADTSQRSSIFQARNMTSASARPDRQDTGATVASEA